MPSKAFWAGRRVLVTGHTGFKGSWLCLWLQHLGARVHGLALDPPTQPALFEVARVAQGLASDHRIDVRDADAVRRCVSGCEPELVLHLAAQPLVRASYVDPVGTYATNVMGTLHLLEAVRRTGSVRAVLNVTTDKCYENREWAWGYRENEAMGGRDPYSSSKACSELLSASYRSSFLADRGVALATSRAGNVIGGGDWADDRLVPDLLRAFERGEPAVIRSPDAVRPRRHVIEPLGGYLHLAERLLTDGRAVAEGWNFGPEDHDARPVRWIVERLARLWGPQARWVLEDHAQPHEAHYLKLDISKASQGLGWRPRWNLAQALEHTLDWHRAWRSGQDMRGVCLRQIDQHQGIHDDLS